MLNGLLTSTSFQRGSNPPLPLNFRSLPARSNVEFAENMFKLICGTGLNMFQVSDGGNKHGRAKQNLLECDGSRLFFLRNLEEIDETHQPLRVHSDGVINHRGFV